MSPRIAEYPRPDRVLLHISDTHLVSPGDELYGEIDSAAMLRTLFAELGASHTQPDALVFTGDLADKGEPEAYRELQAIVEPIAADYGARVIWVPGNHDDRAYFRVGLLNEAPADQPIYSAYDVGGLRVIALDTTVPGHHYGALNAEQLDWLAAELATPAELGTIVALHHPPVPCVLDLAVLVELRDQRQLARVLAGTDVRAIIAGHLHYSTTATFAGIPVSVASATCYTQDLNVASGALRGRNGAQAFNLVHVYPDTVVHSVVPIGAYDTVGEYVSVSETAQRLADADVRIVDSAASARTR